MPSHVKPHLRESTRHRRLSLRESTSFRAAKGDKKRGVTLVEVLTAMTVVAVLLAFSAPTVVKTIEAAHADAAAVSLSSIWNAQRYYWLENRTYATKLSALEAADLLDTEIVNGSERYTFSIVAADASSFTAAATRSGSSVWSGEFTIDETGTIGGTVQNKGAGYVLTPGFH